MYELYLCDFARVILFPADSNYQGELNPLYDELTSAQPGTQIGFFSYFNLNTEVLDMLKINKSRLNYKVAVFTSGDLHEDPELQLSGQLTVFDRIFKVSDFQYDLPGATKATSETYSLICHRLNVLPQKTLFIDKTPANIDAALQAGLDTYLYETKEGLLLKLEHEFLKHEKRKEPDLPEY